MSQLALLTALLWGCKPESSGSRSESIGAVTPISGQNLTSEAASFPNQLLGSPAEELTGIYTGISEDEKLHELVLFEKSLSQNGCLVPTLDQLNNDEKNLRFVFVSIPLNAGSIRFTSPQDAARQRSKVVFASETRQNDQELKVVNADRGSLDFKISDQTMLDLNIEASQGDDSRIDANLQVINCAPNKVSFIFPGLPKVANTFKRYIEVVLTAIQKPNNLAAPKITIHLDAMERPSVVAVSPGEYDVSAKLIIERKEGPQIAKMMREHQAIGLKPGSATTVSLKLANISR